MTHRSPRSSAHRPALPSLVLLALVAVAAPAPLAAQQPPAWPVQTTPTPRLNTASTGLPLPSDYTIGPDDVLGIVFWRDPDMSGDVTVRPDGNITLPLIRDVRAVGLTPEQLRDAIQRAGSKFITDPNVTVVV